ncbi:hypothetical protein AB0L05_21855 [Nonomuraea pusilla]|uniref:hypothetical protein n=1 Tax=Nonomuraea pusilla TaxID=46177 RepID=UPI00332E8423
MLAICLLLALHRRQHRTQARETRLLLEQTRRAQHESARAAAMDERAPGGWPPRGCARRGPPSRRCAPTSPSWAGRSPRWPGSTASTTGHRSASRWRGRPGGCRRPPRSHCCGRHARP